MGLSKFCLNALHVFEPSSVVENTLDFLETMKFETKDLRKGDSILKEELIDRVIKRSKSIKPKKPLGPKTQVTKLFNDFAKNLDVAIIIKNSDDEMIDIKWHEVDEFCSLLRRVERSDERKVRWAIYYILRHHKNKISSSEIKALLKNFKISNVEKHMQRIIKKENLSGLDATFDGKTIQINHDPDDKIIWHYIVDEIEEAARRSPGKIEEDILELIDEGSFSNSELADMLMIDEATVSRTLSKLRGKNKIVLSSFGNRGARYFTTNCDNCPFGTTKAACRKDALTYIINSMNSDFGIELSMKNFEDIEENQVILKIKRIISIAKKEKNTKLEKTITENLAQLLGLAVDASLVVSSGKKNVSSVKLEGSSTMTKLPMLYHLGLYKGAKTTSEILNEMLKISKNITKEERIKMKKLVDEQTRKFLGYASVKIKN